MLLPFIIGFFLQLNGFGAASGIVRDKANLYLISDDSDYLYQYTLRSKEMKKIALRENAQEMRVKKEKLDFEAITQNRDYLFILGSGSKQNRKSWVVVNKKTLEVDMGNYASVFEEMVELSGIPENEINIEGAVADKERLLLFNRGNGKGAHNGVFVFGFSENRITEPVSYTRVDLPVIDGVQFGFSDATRVGRKLFFLATGEATSNVIDDGSIKGSFLGEMDLQTFKVLNLQKISEDKKFEGLVSFKGKSSFLLCEDADDGGDKSVIYKLSKKPAK